MDIQPALCFKSNTKIPKPSSALSLSFISQSGTDEKSICSYVSRYYFTTKIILKSLCGKGETSYVMSLPKHFVSILAPSYYSSVPFSGPPVSNNSGLRPHSCLPIAGLQQEVQSLETCSWAVWCMV